MKYLFYIFAIFPIFWELKNIYDLNKVSKYMKELHKEKWDNYSSTQKTLTILMMFYVFGCL